MFIWGWSTKTIDQRDSNIDCSHCVQPGLVFVALQTFFHIFWIPTFPLKKYYFLICSHCKTEFQPKSFNLESDNTPKSKTPWWGYSGLAVIAIFIGGIMAIDRSMHEDKLSCLESPHVHDVVVIKLKESEEAPYMFARIKRIDGEKITFLTSKYAYSELHHATKESRKASLNSDFLDEILEVSHEDYKKMDIQSIDRPHRRP